MPRMAREKTNDSIFHIMVKSISEIKLFKKDNDKLNYLKLIKDYQKIYQFRVYGYCLMDNHAHFIIDVNGADISKIMHGINFKYAMGFNKRHKRKGHLFQDRFKSKIVTCDRYLLTLSAYIHNNPIDIKGYENCPENYKFSTLALYLGLRGDPYGIVDTSFVMQFFDKLPESARKNYLRFVYMCNDKTYKKEIEFIDDETEYKSERKILIREFKTQDIIKYISEKVGIDKIKLYMKNCRASVDARALLVYFLRCFCNLRCSDICKTLGNITQSRVSGLCIRGMKLAYEDEKYKGILKDFLKDYAA